MRGWFKRARRYFKSVRHTKALVKLHPHIDTTSHVYPILNYSVPNTPHPFPLQRCFHIHQLLPLVTLGWEAVFPNLILDRAAPHRIKYFDAQPQQ